MDRVELYINGWLFAEAEASRDHSIYFNGKTYKSAAKMYERLVDSLEPDLDNQLESLRKKLADHQYFYFYEEDY